MKIELTPDQISDVVSQALMELAYDIKNNSDMLEMSENVTNMIALKEIIWYFTAPAVYDEWVKNV